MITLDIYLGDNNCSLVFNSAIWPLLQDCWVYRLELYTYLGWGGPSWENGTLCYLKVYFIPKGDFSRCMFVLLFGAAPAPAACPLDDLFHYYDYFSWFAVATPHCLAFWLLFGPLATSQCSKKMKNIVQKHRYVWYRRVRVTVLVFCFQHLHFFRNLKVCCALGLQFSMDDDI